MRRLTLLLVAAALAACGEQEPPPAAPPLGPDRITYDLDLRHRPGRLDGRADVRFRNPFAVPLGHVWLRTWANAYGSCARPRITLTALGGARVGARRRDCTAQRIDLPAEVAPGATGRFGLRLAITVPSRFDRFGRLRGVDFLGNALPVLAVSSGGAEPELPPYTFRGESFFSLVADWRVTLRTAPGAAVAATGTESSPGELAATQERDFAMVIGPMREIRARAGGVRVRWWSTGRPNDRGARIAARALEALQRDLGPYGAAELDLVETPARIARGGIAMEYPQLVLSPADPRPVSHEIAHQWFYRLVGNDQWSDPWVDETLSEFAAIRLGRALHGPDRLGGCAQRPRRARPPAPVDGDMAALVRADATRDSLYIEGPCALFGLQRRIGRTAMTRFLRALVEDHRRGILTGEELTRRIGDLDGGRETLSAMRVR